MPTVTVMRMLHTSDWHLGRSFHREDLLAAQARFVDFLVDTVRAERVDAVLVAGDVYDRALPSVDAIALCDDALRRLHATGARIVIISGNHDSARRLGFGADLMDAGGVHLRTDPARAGEPVLLADEAGPVAVYGLPYLEPDAVRAVLGCADGTGSAGSSEGADGSDGAGGFGGTGSADGGHGRVLSAAMGRVRADRARRPGARAVVLAHAFVAGGAGCDSERELRVGGAAAVPPGVFAGVDYVALGHLHGAQALGPGLRYSGSPLAYSFSEEHQRKTVELVELAADGSVRAERLPCPVPRPLARVRGRLDELLTEARWAPYEGHYLQVTLTDAARPREPMERLRARFPHVLVLGFDPQGAAGSPARSYAERLRGRSDHEISLGFVEHVRGRPADPAEAELLRSALEAVRRAEQDPDGRAVAAAASGTGGR